MEPSQPKPSLTFRHFQQVCAHRNLVSFPVVCGNPQFLALALAGEAGEAANKEKKILRRTGEHIFADQMEKHHRDLAIEAADAITYAVLLIDSLGFDVEEVLTSKFNEVSRRPEVNYTAVEL